VKLSSILIFVIWAEQVDQTIVKHKKREHFFIAANGIRGKIIKGVIVLFTPY